MTDFEKLGVFYLGKRFDLEKKKRTDDLVLYESKDLVTHAVCVGMTGSGKTGLCLALLEEAALDGIPAILIDPKGDLGNLLLTFPELRPEDFAPWVNEDDARRKGLSAGEYARQQAELWRKGLEEWGQDGARIRRLREAVDLTIYTPGSAAGRQLSIVRSFEAPTAAVREDAEALRERVAVTASSLLSILGIDADPIKSREHILLATLLGDAWKAGRNLDLAGLIREIQQPPPGRTKIGVIDLETFYPAKERFELAMALNNLVASPSFAAWMEGEPMDVQALLHTPEGGKPRLSIVSIAHLSDSDRMFIVTLLLTEVAGWMRAQTGTTSLRAILYMDEIFGFFPPVAIPPSKIPMLTLLKQARAYGLGVMLTTQNPVDLDYKGLGNTGTWFLGRMQTERDKARVIEGLEGVLAGSRQRFDRAAMERVIAGLGNRVFLMHNVHDDAPEVFETRWAMSYLRGPLTRPQIQQLMAPQKAAAEAEQAARATAAASAPAGVRAAAESPAAERAAAEGAAASSVKRTGSRDTAQDRAEPAAAAEGMTRPVLPPEIPQYFVPVLGRQPEGARVVYEPMLLGVAQLRFADARKGVDATQDVSVLTPITDEAVAVDWDRAEDVDLTPDALETAPVEGAAFAELPAVAGKPKSHQGWSRDLVGWLSRTRTLELWQAGNELSRAGESEGDFRVRLQQASRERRDGSTERLRQKYAPKLTALQEKIRRAEQAEAREAEQVTQSGIQAAISVGATLIGAMLGRKSVTATTLGRATTAARGASRVLKERQDVGRARETLEVLRQQLADLEARFREETEALVGKSGDLPATLPTVALRPTRSNIAVKLVALAWTPSWHDSRGGTTPAWR